MTKLYWENWFLFFRKFLRSLKGCCWIEYFHINLFINKKRRISNYRYFDPFICPIFLTDFPVHSILDVDNSSTFKQLYRCYQYFKIALIFNNAWFTHETINQQVQQLLTTLHLCTCECRYIWKKYIHKSCLRKTNNECEQ